MSRVAHPFKARLLRFGIGLTLLLLGAGVAQAEVALIYHPGLSQEDFSSDNLAQVFVMRTRVWSDGTPVKLFIAPSNTKVHAAFANRYLRMQPYQLERYWHRLVFTGTGTMPAQVASPESMLKAVASTTGAIGYVELDQLDASLLLEFKVGVSTHE